MEGKKKNINSIKLVISDFDGVFTDNKVWVDEDGKESVCCNKSDGMGILRLRKMGINIIILSTEKNSVVRKRARKLNIECYNNLNNKYEFLVGLIKEKKLQMDDVAYIGNDVNDLECMNSVGFAVAVRDAYPEVIQVADLV